MNGVSVVYEYGRVLLSAVGVCGAVMVLWEATQLRRTLQAPHGGALLRDVQQDHLARAAGLVVLNGALLASAAASTGLTPPAGEDWREWLRVAAILTASALAAGAPWWERWRRDRMRQRVRASDCAGTG